MDTAEENKEPLQEIEKTVVESTIEATEIKNDVVEEMSAINADENANLSREELVEQLRVLLEKEDDGSLKSSVDAIKQQFYKKLKEEQSQQKEDKPVIDEAEVDLKTLLNKFKEKRAKQQADEAAQKSKNLDLRNSIIEKIKAFIATPDTVHEHVTEFKQLQQDWRDAGSVSPANATVLFKNYNLSVENFYDLLKMNIELRDYDFKKNLELKTALCESAEKLDEIKDVIGAFHSLQKMHEEWTATGPVSRELREELWLRFKTASTIINKKHQAHFEALKGKEEENLKEKTQLCELIEAIDFDGITTFKDWEEKTEEVIKLQQDWKKIGFAPRKHNVKIYERYRNICDNFFAKKSEFYKEIKEGLNLNLDKKKALVEQAESLKESTDWKDTTQKMISIQKEWKAIGAVPRKQSDVVWKKFVTACDYFFEQKEKHFASQKGEEKDNLAKKKELIEQIANFEKTEDLSKSVTALKELVGKWTEIGHVPFKEKDKIYKEFRAVCDKQFDALNVDARSRDIDTFEVSIASMKGQDKNRLFRERDRLLKKFEHLKSEILTCENNIGFFNPNDKKPNPLIEMMQKNIDQLKSDSDILLKKIQMIEAQLG